MYGCIYISRSANLEIGPLRFIVVVLKRKTVSTRLSPILPLISVHLVSEVEGEGDSRQEVLSNIGRK